eukprot:12426512-Ditylum_brightwellii.AAC.1
MKGIEKKEDQGKWTQEEKASKRKTVPRKAAANNATPTKQSQTIVTAHSNDTSATKTGTERMKERGEGYIDNESVIKTPVEAQWVLKLGSTTLHIRAAILVLLKLIATVNDTVYLET